MRVLSLFVVVLAVSGCAGKVEYLRPTSVPMGGSNVKVIDKPREMVWNAAVPELGKRFFVINNLDKSSGLINISYSGDPEKYIDCGRITSYVKNARGERTYNFPGAKAQQTYEVMDANRGGLFFLDRRMSLEGRVNLIFEEVGSNQTRVTANTRYVVQRQQTVTAANNTNRTFTDTGSFNTGASGTIGSGDRALECAPTGMLEREVLDAIR